MMATAPVFRDGDGQEHALGPLELALVRAVLGLAVRMRSVDTYEASFTVRRGWVHLKVTQRVGDVQVYAGED